ncbi:MAG: hypothetical protein WBM45_16250 [Woeseiaceae bacterium]
MLDENKNAEFRELTKRLYDVISAPCDQRDWDAVRPLFHPRATMVRTGLDDAGQPFALVMSHDEYIANATELLKGVRFCETELRQEVTVFGNVARLASVYRFSYEGETSSYSGQGVNFFNLLNEGDGWKIINMVWDNERPGVSLQDARLLWFGPEDDGAGLPA